MKIKKLKKKARRFFREIWWSIKNRISKLHYFLVSHIIPGRKYHKLNLSQPNGYKWGWIDADTQLLYACFNILKNYVEQELGQDHVKIEYSEEELNDPCMGELNKKWQAHYKEIDELYIYWVTIRPEWEKIINRLSGQERWEEQDKFDEKETEMLIRLVKTRGGMWT